MQLATALVFLMFARTCFPTEILCEDLSEDAGKISLRKETVRSVIAFSNDTNVVSSLRLAFRWNLHVPDGIRYDGLLYKYVDRTQAMETAGDYPCDTRSGKSLWAVTQNNTSVECKMPCSSYFPSNCSSKEVCFRRNNGYQPLRKSTEHLEFDVKFGRAYDITLLVYRHWGVLKELSRTVTLFCAEELIAIHGISEAIATEYCNKTQKISDSEYATGPPSRLEQHSIVCNLSNKRAKVVFRWKNPYDISPNVASITHFTIYNEGGVAKTLFVAQKHRCFRSYYCVEINDVEFQKDNYIRVTPYVRCSNLRGRGSCSSHGYSASRNYTISEMNVYNGTLGCCDVHATPTELPGRNGTAAICKCLDGYIGNGINASLVGYIANGINTSFVGGTGCKDFDGCSLLDANTCATGADCVDLPPPSMGATCSCISSSFGDGYKNGTGCTKLSDVVLASTVVPLALAVIIVLVIFARRKKLAKMGSKRFSKFLASSDVKYSAPLVNSLPTNNGDRRLGAFGAKYEIERERIQFTGILGRGNFGVVHRATIATNDGCKVVAVKTTAEPHSEEMEREFLAEIGLITAIGNHENIIGMIGCCTRADSIIYLVTQFMKYGDLQHFLWDAREEKNRKEDPTYNLSERSIYYIGEQVANGLGHLTGLRIIHGDIAARNVLVDEGLKCRISDFGLANDVYRYGAIKGAREKNVPIKWISPERMQAGRVPITWRSDVWSFGILLYESITIGAAPFSEVSQEQLFPALRSGYRMPKPACCSTFLYSVMMKCWEWTPSKRPSFQELKGTMKTATSSQVQPVYVNLSEELST